MTPTQILKKIEEEKRYTVEIILTATGEYVAWVELIGYLTASTRAFSEVCEGHHNAKKPLSKIEWDRIHRLEREYTAEYDEGLCYRHYSAHTFDELMDKVYKTTRQ